MKLFNRDKSYKNYIMCWYCERLFDPEDVEWKPRQVGMKGDTPLATEILTRQLREMAKNSGNKDALATPNRIFGALECEYRGKCPNCNVEQTCFWLGKESVSRNEGIKIDRKPFPCSSCKNLIEREFQVWYSVRTKDKYEIEREYFVTICRVCKEQIEYPYKYDLEYGNIE